MADVANNDESTPTLGGITGKGFMPGQSGNPSGRPKKRLIDQILTELLEANEGADAAEIAKALIAMAKKDSKTAQLVAERTEGKPTQKHEVTGGDGGPIQSRIILEFVKPGEVS